MGLAQRQVEAAGISTVALSTVPDLTVVSGAPRVAATDFPFGRPLGQPHDAATQHDVLVATLDVLREAKRAGTVVHLPFLWPEAPDATHWHPKEPSPIIQLLGREPSLFRRLLDGDLPPEASRR